MKIDQSKVDQHWMATALLAARYSHDPDAKTGAVITDPSGNFVTSASNRLPIGVKLYPARLKRPAKYAWIQHAESMAIASAGRSLVGCTIYATYAPCSDCMAEIINNGIRRVVTFKLDPKKPASVGANDWSKSQHIARQMAEEAGVEMVALERDHV